MAGSRFKRRKLRYVRYTPGTSPTPILPFRLGVTAGAAQYTEGDLLSFGITLDTQGYTRLPGDPSIVLVIQPVGPPDGTAAANDFNPTLTSVLAAIVQTGYSYELRNGLHTITLAYNFVGPLVITRQSLDDLLEEGDETTGIEILSAIVASPHNVQITTPRVIVDLLDTGGPPPPPTLSLSATGVMEGAANGSVTIGLFSSSAGGTPQFTLTHVDGVAIDGTDRFKITGLNALQPGTVPTDYETQTNHIVRITSSDGGGPTDFNVTVFNDASDDVTEYRSTVAPDGRYVTVGAPAGFALVPLTVPGTITGRAIVDVGTYRYSSYLNAFGAGVHYDDLRNIFAISGSNLVVAAAHTETRVVNQPQQSSGTLNFFEGTYGGPQTPLVMTGCGWYAVTVLYTFSGGGTQTAVYRIRPEYKPITPVNSSAFTDAPIASVGAFKTAIESTVPNRIIRVPAAVIGVAETNSTVSVTVNGNNLLIQGHERFVCLKDSKISIRGNNIHLKDLQILIGTDTSVALLAAGTPSGRDPLEIINTSGEIYIENCTIGWGTDDIGLGTNAPKGTKRIHHYRCLIAEPSWANLHEPPQTSHPYGPRHGSWLTQVEMLKCIIIGHKARSPQIDGNFGYLLQNNIIGLTSNVDSGATAFTFASLVPPIGTTVVSRDNLYLDYNRPFQLNGLSSLEEIYAVNKVITAPSPGGATADIPVLNTDGLSGQNEPADFPNVHTLRFERYIAANPAVFRTYLPFLPPSTPHYESMPIVTEANRNALIADVLDYAGCRKRDGSGNLLSGDANAAEITRRILSNFRAKTNSGIYQQGIALINHPIDTCAVGAGGDACRAVFGFVTGP